MRRVGGILRLVVAVRRLIFGLPLAAAVQAPDLPAQRGDFLIALGEQVGGSDERILGGLHLIADRSERKALRGYLSGRARRPQRYRHITPELCHIAAATHGHNHDAAQNRASG